VSTGLELFAPAGTPVTAPVAGTLSVDGDSMALTLESTDPDLVDREWRLLLSGLADVTTASKVGPGDRLGVVADADLPHVRAQLVADLEHTPPWLATRASGW
jgi:hypothetical protein